MLNQFNFRETGCVGVQVNVHEARDLIRSQRTAYILNGATETAVLLFCPPENNAHISPDIALVSGATYPPEDQLEHAELLGNIHALKEFPAEWIIGPHEKAANEPAFEQDTPSLNSQSAEFLECLLGDSTGYITALDPDAGPRDALTLRPGNYAAAAEFLEAQTLLGRNLYFGFNGIDAECEVYAGRPKAKKSDITGILGFHADIDPAPDASPEGVSTEKQNFLNIVPAALRPSVVIDSGNGLQLIWLLDQPIDLKERADRDDLIRRVEWINKALSAAVSAPLQFLKADSTQNIDRILRVPGTLNFPNRKKREAGRTECLSTVMLFERSHVFSLESLEACLRSDFPEFLDAKPQQAKLGDPLQISVFNALDSRRRSSTYLDANATRLNFDPKNRLTCDQALLQWHLSTADKGDGRSPTSSKLSRLWRGDFSDYPGNSEGMMALLSTLAGELPGWVTVPRLFELASNADLAIEAYNQHHGGDKWGRRGPDDCAKAITLRLDALEARAKLKNEAEALGHQAFLQAAGFITDPEDEDDDDQIAHYQIAALDKFSDLANAQRLLNHHGKDLLFLEGKVPLRWDGIRWRAEDVGMLGDLGMILPMQLSRLIEDNEVKLIKDQIEQFDQDESGDASELRNLLGEYEAWQKKSEDKNHIVGASVLFKKALSISLDRLDKDAMTIVCESGTVDLKSGQLRPSRRLDLGTRCIAAKFDPEARCPRFVQFLDEIFIGKKDLIRYVQQLFGQSLLGEVTEHILPVLWGNGRNGKGTFIGLLQRILGPYSTTLPADRLVSSKGSSRDVERVNASFHGNRLVIAQESGNSAYLDESFVKTATGGDRLSARRLYAESFDFEPQHTLCLVTNHKPQIQGKDDGVWGRLRLIPFQAQFMVGKDGASKPDPYLGEKLWAERDGVFRWLLDGLQDYQTNGLLTPAEVMAATAQYREDEDRMLLFLDEWMMPVAEKSVAITHVFQSYRVWCEQEEGAKLTMKRKTFVEALKDSLHNANLEGRVRKCPKINQHVIEGWMMKPVDQRPRAQGVDLRLSA